MVDAVPMLVLVADIVEARGIVFNVCVPLAVTETAYVYTLP